METRPLACMTVDWEDFGQLYCSYEHGVVPEPRRDIERQTEIVLELLGETGVRATFFVLGMLAKHRPDLVKKIAADGHEVAAHGTSHTALTRLDPDGARRDIADAVNLISDIIGGPVHGFRAPIFSITRDNLYVLDLLAELGLTYDSSIFPKALPRYGIAGFDPGPRHYQLPQGGRIVELPLTVLPWAGRIWPVSGGGYLRLLPRLLLPWLERRIAQAGRPLILYTHPYEFDSQPLDVASNAAAFPPARRLYLNCRWNLFRRGFLDKVRYFLNTMRFETCKEVADDVRRNQCTRLLG